MAMTTASGNASFLPTDTGELIVRPVTAASIATIVSTVVTTDANTFRIPVVSADPAAAWVAEGAEITPADATLTEAAVTFKKLAGLTIVSNEMIADASPEAAKVIGDGLARDIARKLDAAYFANTTTDGPSGLLSITPSVVDTGSWTNTDPFTEAIYTAAGQGANIDAWVTNPADALTMAKLKELTTGSNKPLLQPDPTLPSRRMIAGVPLFTSTSVGTGTAWGIPKDRVFVVIRNDVDLQVDKSVFFTSDRSAIRATMRVGFAFPHPLAVVRLYDAP